MAEYDIYEYFADYKAGEPSLYYYGIITNIEIEAFANDDPDDLSEPGIFNCNITIKACIDDELAELTRIIKDITCSRRNLFQELIEQFDLIKENEKGIAVLSLQKMLGKICMFDKQSYIDKEYISKIQLAEFYDQDTQEYYKEIFSHEKISSFDKSSLPDIIKHYTIIPAFKPKNDFIPYIEYDGFISDISLWDDKYNEGEKAFILTITLFNGQSIATFKKYINFYDNNNHKKLDKLFYDFDIINDEGSIEIEQLKNRFCIAALYENQKNNLTIGSLIPLNIVGKYAQQQYADLINYNKTKGFKANHY